MAPDRRSFGKPRRIEDLPPHSLRLVTLWRDNMQGSGCWWESVRWAPRKFGRAIKDYRICRDRNQRAGGSPLLGFLLFVQGSAMHLDIRLVPSVGWPGDNMDLFRHAQSAN